MLLEVDVFQNKYEPPRFRSLSTSYVLGLGVSEEWKWIQASDKIGSYCIDWSLRLPHVF